MDYNNMNKRASRSAYNYDNDRRTTRTNNSRRREDNFDFSDFKKKSRPAAQNTTVHVRNHGTNMQKPQRVRPEQRQNPQRPPQRTNNNGQRPGNYKNNPRQNTSVSKTKSAAAKRSAPKNQQRRNDWVYPEGFNPGNAPRRRAPQDPRRRAQNPQGRRPQQRKKSAPAIRIHIDWQRVGAICAAVSLRFVCCIIAVVVVLSGYFALNFYTKPEAPADEITYVFSKVSGEGEDAVTVSNEIKSEGALAYDRSELLISFSEVSKWLGTAQVGDIYSMRFVLGSDGASETVVFHNSSQDAFVNGTPVIMKSRAQFRHGEVWIPVSFIKDYITGIEIKEEKNSVMLSLNGEELSFILAPTGALSPIVEIEEE